MFPPVQDPVGYTNLNVDDDHASAVVLGLDGSTSATAPPGDASFWRFAPPGIVSSPEAFDGVRSNSVSGAINKGAADGNLNLSPSFRQVCNESGSDYRTEMVCVCIAYAPLPPPPGLIRYAYDR